MDLIRISDTKLKIMLTNDDMQKYQIHNDADIIPDGRMRDTLKRLLCDARVQDGFIGDDSRVYIQMFPCAKGGCELFISRLDEQIVKDTRPSKKADRNQLERIAYSFVMLDDLIRLCKRLNETGFTCAGNAYVDKGKKYYLILYDIPIQSLYEIDRYCFIAEYGKRENAKNAQQYLDEYGSVICHDNAVQTLAQFCP